MKPNYMVIGATKCGTSTFCTLLGKHPEVFMVDCKEPFFFSNDEIYELGFEWYESLYENAGNKKMLGEGSNRYTMKEVFPKTVSRIVSYAPDLKLIYIVRNPIPRIESLWLEKRIHGGETVDYNFNTAVRVNREWLVDSSNYWQQINAYRKYYADDNILILFFEDLIQNPNEVMRRCFEFLEVNPDLLFGGQNLHIGQTSGRLIPRIMLSHLRSYPVFRAFVKLIPEFIRNPLKKQFFFKKIKKRPTWDTNTRQWVIEVLEKDTRKFLEYAGKPVDFWDF